MRTCHVVMSYIHIYYIGIYISRLRKKTVIFLDQRYISLKNKIKWDKNQGDNNNLPLKNLKFWDGRGENCNCSLNEQYSDIFIYLSFHFIYSEDNCLKTSLLPQDEEGDEGGGGEGGALPARRHPPLGHGLARPHLQVSVHRYSARI